MPPARLPWAVEPSAIRRLQPDSLVVDQPAVCGIESTAASRGTYAVLLAAQQKIAQAGTWATENCLRVG